MEQNRNNVIREDGGEQLSVDAILDLLSHHHRRAILRHLRTSEQDCVPQDEIIQLLSEQEVDRTGREPSWDHLSTSIHHVHIPKLSQAGVVKYNESNKEYCYSPNVQLEKWLDLVESEHTDKE